ncbi:MAG: hypothetical protein IIC55_10445 [Proteobacteria bacterium]|nr:hypothetical protein [Pseudomonadota bacterium]
MNICLVNNLFPPINTGSSFYTYAVAKSLLKRGHNVVVITNRKDNERLIEYYKGIKVYRLPVLTLPKLELWMKFPDFNFSLFPKNFSMNPAPGSRNRLGSNWWFQKHFGLLSTFPYTTTDDINSSTLKTSRPLPIS